MREARAGLALAGMSGILYGSVNVAAKIIGAHPLAMASIAYLTGALILSPALRGLRVAPADRAKVLVMGLVGGGLSPALLFFGLRHTAAVDAGLLLTLELVATALIAVVWLGEREGPRGWTALGLLACAAALVAFGGRESGQTTTMGVALVSASAVGWGFDNAVSARLVGTYRPLQLLAVKAILGGVATGIAALAMRAPMPEAGDLAALLAVGALGITLSSWCYYQALRWVGAARTSGLNVPTTAMVGAVAGAWILHESIGWFHAAAFASLVAGVALLAGSARKAVPGPGT